VRNCRQVGPDRRGAGSMPAAFEMLAAADGDDDGAIHGDDVNRAFRVAFVGVVAR